MIYLDSAATTFQKPAAVQRAVVQAMRTMSSPGRGGYAAAQQALRDNADLPPAERAEAAILGTCRWLSETRALVFIENDAEFLLRRLPQEVKSAHYHDDEVHIRALLEGSGLQPKGGMALAAATVRGLILTVSHQEQIGELYPKVLETLVRGACRELF